jgi:signal transduction histidine kinase
MRILRDPSSPTIEAPARRGGHILVLDSDESLVRTLGAILRHDGYEVLTAVSLYDAIIGLHDQTVDMILSELRADDADGEDTLARARALVPGAVVIVLTRYATFESALRALRAGAYDYLVKPVDVDELRLTVERGLEHARLQRELATHMRELEAAQTQLHGFNSLLQQQVDDATRELRSKVHALDDANAHLRRAQEEHDRFVAMVAHEMRGPLNPIINYAQLAKRPAISREQLEHYTDIIVEHAFRLNRLVDDLQTATRLSTDQFTLHRSECDVAEAVGEVVANFMATVRDRVFTFERPPEPVIAYVDHDRVLQAIRNLIDNAVKYSSEGGAVEASVWRDETRVYMRVRDYGAGIPEAAMAEIFQAFTRLEKRPDVGGTGLGLYITRGIVKEHGGELTVANGSGPERARGAIFTIALPLHPHPIFETTPAADAN